ncbi:MAG TPA: gephyrin-like molybdotransferase Glp [Actinomycetota bacterium]|nr:gephyrin-like molybdotransferase Glp [Actinomycetota bacterium]
MTKRTVTKEELERPLIAYREAVDQILSAFAPLPPEMVPLERALGLANAEPVVATFDVPGFDNSAMDGYAVRAADIDTPGTILHLVDDLPAGSDPQIEIGPGTAATIMTGAPLPPGADAVVPWEDTQRRDDVVVVLRETTRGKHVRPAGEDIRAGDVVVQAGTELRPVHLGVIASLGLDHVRAHRRPRVAILSTGDELAAAGDQLKPGHVYDANGVLLSAACARAGADIAATALIGDEPDVIATWLRQVARHADLIVTTGGASVGEHDWIRAILEAEGELKLWRVAIKPGKPIAFGRFDDTPVLGLPGNPGSAFVGMHVFVARAIRALAARPIEPASVRAKLGAAVKGSPSRTLFARVALDGDVATPLPAQSSVVLSNIIPADGFAIVPPGGLPEGAGVTVEMI